MSTAAAGPGTETGGAGPPPADGGTGGVSLAEVRYDRYLRFIWPLPAILFVLICGFVSLGAVATWRGRPVVRGSAAKYAIASGIAAALAG
ncbi:hypothetical protein [Streptomyces sp. NRRL F-5123]|uniref:hypothetical protein n=1 Tax=Streptomyces sp. NRRL F-5123 TaxID=1463856 RepID=UPI0004E1DC3F|nr:hypothetical protein [Streptomyces sp. NRRL F-5123]